MMSNDREDLISFADINLPPAYTDRQTPQIGQDCPTDTPPPRPSSQAQNTDHVQSISTISYPQLYSAPPQTQQHILLAATPQVAYATPTPNYPPQPVFLSQVDESKRNLQENYPTSFIIFHCIFMILMSLGEISVQVVLMFHDNYMAYLPGGFITGGFLLFTSFLTLATISCRSYCLISMSVICHLLGLVVSFVFAITVNLAIILKHTCLTDFVSCESDLVFMLRCGLVSIGCVVGAMCIVFAIVVQCSLIGKTASKPRKVYYQFVPQPTHNTHQYHYS